MRRTILIISTVILILGLSTYHNAGKTKLVIQKRGSTINQGVKDMKNYISIFEIPATDISRAIEFYQTILDINIEKMEMPGLEMGIFPYEGQIITGVIMKGEGFKPSAEGVTIYLNAGNNLQVILDKVEQKNSKIIVPKTLHADESGYFAIFLDSEGNKIGLHSPN